jgi:hypothetical protein
MTSRDTNVDLTTPVIIQAMDLPWHPSPSPTVWRKSLYRQGGEQGPVTSLVRYDADSRFAGHVHPEGEEILVLDGVLSDEHGDYPAGTYLLNPAGTGHAPFSKEGCVLFVHLRQYNGQHRKKITVDTNALTWQKTPVSGVSRKLLYSQQGYPDLITLEQWSSGVSRTLEIKEGGAELLVLDGFLENSQEKYGPYTWFRLPANSGEWHFRSGTGCTIYLR